jgi:type VII secretion protein EccE
MICWGSFRVTAGGFVPHLTRAQLVLLELAAAVVAGGIAVGGVWRWAGVLIGAAVLALAVVPVHRRWLYQLGLSWVSMVRRRQLVRGPGLQSLLGGYRVTTVPPGSQGTPFGVVRSGTTWTLPLELTLDGIYNDDSPVPVDQLTALLHVEDVPMASVRLLTVFSPAQLAGGAPAGPVAPPARLVSRYCVLTMDTTLAADAVAARGGTEAALHQILRRCALRAEQILAAVGVRVRRLDERAVTALFGVCIGPADLQPSGSRPTSESWRDIRVAGTWSTSYAVTGTGGEVPDALARVASGAPTAVAVSSLMLQSTGPRTDVTATLALRLSGPGSSPDGAALAATVERAEAAGLVMQRLDGEQGRLLRATMPVGVGIGA